MVKHHHTMVKGIQTYVNHEGSGHGLRPEMVATALSDLADDDAVFTVDTGMCNVWGARYLQMKPGRRILASFSHGSMANAMPQAIGAKVGSPDRQVVALCGDGGFSMLMGELLTAAGLDIPVKLMVFNNSTLGMVRAEMMVVGYQPWGTDVKNPDFGAVATAAGLHGERVENADDIRPAIERAFAHPGPALIDFVTDPRALAVPPHTTRRGGQGLRPHDRQARLQRRRRRGVAAGQVQHPRRRPGPLAVDISQLDLSRLQFASTTIYHFFFVPVTIGLAFLVAVLHTMWYRSGDPELRRLTRFFGTLLVINIAIGVVTGLVQEFEFGMNWSEYSRFVGDVFGAPLAMEGLAAFFLESTFLGLWVFGWNVLPRAGAPGLRSGRWRWAPRCRRRSSWPPTPGCSTRSGYTTNADTGRPQLTSIGGLFTNPVFVWGYIHVLLASLVTGAW